MCSVPLCIVLWSSGRIFFMQDKRSKDDFCFCTVHSDRFLKCGTGCTVLCTKQGGLLNGLCNCCLVCVPLCCLRFANIILLLLLYILHNFICNIVSYAMCCSNPGQHLQLHKGCLSIEERRTVQVQIANRVLGSCHLCLL